jgi:glycosyltransferase involved in cell wall biosynthesis
MRVVAYTDNTELGGADLSLSHLLAELDQSIHVTVLGVASTIVERLAAVRSRTHARVVPKPSSGHDVLSLRAHAAALRKARPDIVHANLSSPWSCQYCIAAAAVVRGARTVAVYQLAVPPVSERQRRAKRLTSRTVACHVGVGERTSREVEALVGLREASVLTIHNGVPDEPLPRQVHRPRPGPIIGAIGRVEHQKGFDTLIRAVAQVAGATVWIVGDGRERAALERLAADVGIGDRIVWTGWRDDARSFLGTFDVVAFPSRFEGFPLAVLEALLARSAVVAADVGSIAEVVRDGETGLLVPPDDPSGLARAISRLLDDRDLRERLGCNGRELVLRRFTAAHMARRFEALYDELLR